MGSSYDTQQQEICHPMGRLSLTGSCLRKNTGVVVGCAPRTVGIPTHIMNLANRNTTRNPAPLPHRARTAAAPWAATWLASFDGKSRMGCCFRCRRSRLVRAR